MLQFYMFKLFLVLCFLHITTTQDDYDYKNMDDFKEDELMYSDTEEIVIEETTSSTTLSTTRATTTLITTTKKILSFCETWDWDGYVDNCTEKSQEIFDNNELPLPLPADLILWCKLTEQMKMCSDYWMGVCSSDEVFDYTGHYRMGLLKAASIICSEKANIDLYQIHSGCITNVTEDWDKCYKNYSNFIRMEKYSTLPWTHYSSHFRHCCHRAKFRRCTLEALTRRCNEDAIMYVQNFAVILSKCMFNQDCDLSVDYAKCSGGDPRPKSPLIRQVQLRDNIVLARSFGSNTSAGLRVYYSIFCVIYVLLYIFEIF